MMQITKTHKYGFVVVSLTGFVLAILIGFFNYDGLGNLISKGFTALFAWAGVYVVVVVVLQKFIPELYEVIFEQEGGLENSSPQNEDKPGSESEGSQKGSQVDITLGDDSFDENHLGDEADSSDNGDFENDFSNLEDQFKKTVSSVEKNNASSDTGGLDGFSGGGSTSDDKAREKMRSAINQTGTSDKKSGQENQMLNDFHKMDSKELAKGVQSVMKK